MCVCVQVRDGVLRIQQVRAEDRGVYVCEAENSAGSDYDTVTIELESTLDQCQWDTWQSRATLSRNFVVTWRAT